MVYMCVFCVDYVCSLGHVYVMWLLYQVYNFKHSKIVNSKAIEVSNNTTSNTAVSGTNRSLDKSHSPSSPLQVSYTIPPPHQPSLHLIHHPSISSTIHPFHSSSSISSTIHPSSIYLSHSYTHPITLSSLSLSHTPTHSLIICHHSFITLPQSIPSTTRQPNHQSIHQPPANPTTNLYINPPPTQPPIYTSTNPPTQLTHPLP